MKIYSIRRGGRGRGRGSILLVFFLFSWPSRPWLQPEELLHPSSGAGRGDRDIQGAWRMGPTTPQPPKKHRGMCSGARAAVLQTQEKGGSGGRDPSIPLCQRWQLGCPLPSSPARAFLLQSLPGQRGAACTGGSWPPRHARHPSPGLPCDAAGTIALATGLAGEAMHHGGIKEQRLLLTAVFFWSNSISAEQRGSIELGGWKRGGAVWGGDTWERYVWGARSEEMQISLLL